MEKQNFEVCVGHLGAYNAGYLVEKVIEFPIDEDEIASSLKEIQNEAIVICDEHGDEFHNTDWELPFEIERFTSLYKINEMVRLVEDFTEEDFILLKLFLDDGFDLEDAVEKVQDREYRIYYGCTTMAHVAEEIIKDIGFPKRDLDFYADIEKLIRDLEYDSYFCVEDDEEEFSQAAKEEIAWEIYDCLDDERKKFYFNYEAFGRDLEIEGSFHFEGVSEGSEMVIEIFNY